MIAYPEPQYNLKYKNGTLNNEMKVNLHKNAMNNFTIFFEQQFIREIASVTYSLEFGNFLGSSTILVHILKQGRCSLDFLLSDIINKWYMLLVLLCTVDYNFRLLFLRK